MERKCMSVTEMAKVIGIARATAYNLVKQESFYPAFRIGKKILINVEALDRWVNEQTT